MTRKVLLFCMLALAVGAGVGMYAARAAGQDKTAKESTSRHACPGCAALGVGQERPGLNDRVKALCKQADLSEASCARSQALIFARLYGDETAVLLGRSKELTLSVEQVQKLQAIQADARQKAKAILNDEQVKLLGDIPADAQSPQEAISLMHAKMLPVSQKMIKDAKGSRESGSLVLCPMMLQANGTATKPKD